MGYGIRRLMVIAVALAGMAAGTACGLAPGNPGPKPMDLSARQTRAPGEYLVTLVPGAESKVIADLYGRFGIKDMKDLGSNLFLVTLTEDPGPAKMEELREQNAQVKAVQPNFVYRIQ
ncbi:MAG: hypothetical protein A2X58_00765 [Nitrospirae bacterium GWC2_56_14]|nr:MAG: hypothetical protein A2X58_00765 [Nitrospirae bacterium GWC2_56_14]